MFVLGREDSGTDAWVCLYQLPAHGLLIADQQRLRYTHTHTSGVVYGGVALVLRGLYGDSRHRAAAPYQRQVPAPYWPTRLLRDA
eukprot:3122048-Rhodomonas_salina.1